MNHFVYNQSTVDSLSHSNWQKIPSLRHFQNQQGIILVWIGPNKPTHQPKPRFCFLVLYSFQTYQSQSLCCSKFNVLFSAIFSQLILSIYGCQSLLHFFLKRKEQLLSKVVMSSCHRGPGETNTFNRWRENHMTGVDNCQPHRAFSFPPPHHPFPCTERLDSQKKSNRCPTVFDIQNHPLAGHLFWACCLEVNAF